MTEPLPADVTALLDRLESVLELEVLLALYDATEPMTPGQLTRRVGGSVKQATDCLIALVRVGLATHHPHPTELRFTYVPNADDHTVERLAQLYVATKVGVVSQLLRSATHRRVLSAAGPLAEEPESMTQPVNQ